MACPIGCGKRRCTHTLSSRIKTVKPKGSGFGCTSASDRRRGKGK